ncbi:hypothetical protein DFJ73DRAFT_850653 [Zopfochytrium polystomum]|nr:hypothetical protein DFJ73DRAFT_850653 [Zopfochytrium polystomum]
MATPGGAGLVTALQNDLATLANEAKRKHPDLKEAADRLNFILKTLKEKAPASPTSPTAAPEFVVKELAKSDDVLRPFLKACDTKNTKLLPVAVGSLQRIVINKALPATAVPSIIRAFGDCYQVGDQTIQVKILQTVLPLLTNFSSLHGTVVGESLVLCMRLMDPKSPMVHGTASATLRQLAVFVFDKVVAEDKSVAEKGTAFGSAEQRQSGVLLPSIADAYVLFQDLCQLANGEPPNFLPISAVPKNLVLELIDAILSSHWSLFQSHMELFSLLRDRICPTLLKAFKENGDFFSSVRVLRVVSIIVKHFTSTLSTECEIFLSMLTKLLDPETNVPPWQRVLVLEVYRGLCSMDGFIQSIFKTYDLVEGAESSAPSPVLQRRVFTELVEGIARVAVGEKPGVLLGPNGILATAVPESPVAAAVGGGAQGNSSGGGNGGEGYAFSISSASMKMQCIDQLDKIDPPAIPDFYPMFLALQCVLQIADHQATFILPSILPTTGPTSSDTPTAVDEVPAPARTASREDIILAIEMANASLNPIIATFSFLLASNQVDDDLFHALLSTFQGFTAMLGLLGLSSDRDGFLATLCRLAVPVGTPLSSEASAALRALTGLCPAAAHMAAVTPGVFFVRGFGGGSGTNNLPTAGGNLPSVVISTSGTPTSSSSSSMGSPGNLAPHHQLLGDRNVACICALLSVSTSLASVLDDVAWFPILEALQAADGHVSAGKLGGRRESTLSIGTPASNEQMREFGRLRSSSLLVPAGSTLGAPSSIQTGTTSTGPGSGLENQYTAVVAAIRKFFDDSSALDEKSFAAFVNALCHLVTDSALSQVPPLSLTSVLVSNVLRESSSTSSSGNLSAPISPPQPKAAALTDDRASSFAIHRLHDVAIANRSRLVLSPSGLKVYATIANKLTDVSHAPTGACSTAIRSHACTSFGEVLETAVREADLKSSTLPDIELEVLAPLRRFMLLDSDVSSVPAGAPAIPNFELHQPVVRGLWVVDVQKSGMETLKRILEARGRDLKKGWGLVFEVIRSVVAGAPGGAAGGLPKRAKAKAATTGSGGSGAVNGFVGGVLSMPVSEGGMLAGVSIGGTGDSGGSGKAAVHVRAGFAVLELICDNLLEWLVPTVLLECIETLGCFGSQPDDVNISLTAIRYLWSVSDNILNQRLAAESSKTGEEPSSGHPGATPMQPRERKSYTGRAKSEEAVKEIVASFGDKPTAEVMDVLWMHLLAHLSQLCSDPRPDVRISANQTLFRTISTNGRRLTLDAWGECIWNVLFPLLERVKISSERVELIGRLTTAVSETGSASPTAGGGASRKGGRNNNVSKQWDETKTNTLTGVTTSIISFFPVLVELGEDFDRAWGLFHDYIRTWCLEGSPEVATAAVRSLRTLVRYPKDLPAAPDGSPGKVLPNVEVRLKDLWRASWDTWEAIGLGIVACADENIGGSGTPREMVSRSGSIGSVRTANGNLNPNQLLHGPFAQETLTVLVSVFPDIFDVIKETFSLFELKRLLAVLSALLLYHTNPAPDALPSKIRADNISDIDNVTPLQEATLSLAVGAAASFDAIRGAPEAIICTVAGFIRLPFLRLSQTSSAAQAVRIQPAGGMDKGFTYMALAKRSLQQLVALFEKHGGMATIYSGGSFETVVEALDVPMRAKYDCPAPGVKDSTPLWRCAANTAVTIVELGLKNLDRFVPDLPTEILNSIYCKILDLFDGFLLPSSAPPSQLSPEDLAVDTDFDISVFETFQTDVIQHMGQAHVADDLIVGLVRIIVRCSTLYIPHVPSLASAALHSSAMATSSQSISQAGQMLMVSTSATALEATPALESSSEAPATVASPQSSRPGSGKPASSGGGTTGTAMVSSPPPSRPGSGRPRLSTSEAHRRSLIVAPKKSATPSAAVSQTDLMGSRGASVRSSMHAGNEGTGAARTSVVGGAYAEPMKVLGVDVVPVGREKFAKRCLECLLRLCAEKDAGSEIARRVATVAAPYFLEKAKEVIGRYCEDRPLFGRIPLPRIRTDEIILVLARIKDLQMFPGILTEMIEENKIRESPFIAETRCF